MARILAVRWLSVLLAVALLAALVRPPSQPGWPPTGWVIVACDVGQGDGLVVSLGPGQAMVVDTGPDPAAMQRCLDRLRITDVPLLVLTHFHADHVDGLSAVLDHRRVGRIWVSPLPAPMGGVNLVRSLAGGARVPVETPAVGSAGRLGPMTWTVLGPVGMQQVPIDDAAGSESETENNSSLVMMIEISGIRILLTGDVEPPGQAAMLAAGDDLRADILKVPHHGSAQQNPQFLAATHARFAIASAGLHNDYGHPAPRTVAALTALGMTVLRTDTEGSIAVAVRPDHTLVAVAQRDPALTSGR